MKKSELKQVLRPLIKECIKDHNNKKVDELSATLIKNIERTNGS